MSNPITAIKTLYSETVSEMKKCTWPTKNELFESAVVVISSLVILSVFVVVADQIVGTLIRLLTGMA